MTLCLSAIEHHLQDLCHRQYLLTRTVLLAQYLGARFSGGVVGSFRSLARFGWLLRHRRLKTTGYQG